MHENANLTARKLSKIEEVFSQSIGYTLRAETF